MGSRRSCALAALASHKHDLRAAAQHGLKTAFIKRPHELGRNNNPDLGSEPEFTYNAESFLDLADQLDASSVE